MVLFNALLVITNEDKCTWKLITTTTCETKTSLRPSDIILTYRTRSFKDGGTIKTGLSDFHKLVMTPFRSTYEKLRPTRQ